MERQGTLYEICIYKWKNLKWYKRHAGTGGAGHSGGKYILPGLINMHVHLAGNGKPQKKQRDNEALVKKIMSNGLTKGSPITWSVALPKTSCTVVEKNPLEDIRALRNVDMVVSQGKVLRSPKVKKKQIVETELDKFL